MVKTTNFLILSLFTIIVLIFFSCYPFFKREVETPQQALVQVKWFYPRFNDDMDIDSLSHAIAKDLEYIDRLDSENTFTYGPHEYTCLEVRDSLETFLRIMRNASDLNHVNRGIKRNFRIYKAAGRTGKGRVLFTGYFEPTFEASLKPNNLFKYPIYRKPDNLIRIDLSLFNEKYENETIIARIEDKNVYPYYSRKQIDVEKALQGKGLEIAWLKDPVDAAFLHIQGSGRLRLPDGEVMSVGYAASNGRPYHSIGRYMLEKGYMDREDMSMQGIRHFLRMNPGIIDEVLNYNPSYVFFSVKENGPFGNIQVALTPGRSIALDSRLFPKGALCFISCEKPVFKGDGKIDRWTPFSRFVLNQDTGGAIKGSGRADIFWGSDEYAEIAAGNMQHEGELYVLIKKP